MKDAKPRSPRIALFLPSSVFSQEVTLFFIIGSAILTFSSLLSYNTKVSIYAIGNFNLGQNR